MSKPAPEVSQRNGSFGGVGRRRPPALLAILCENHYQTQVAVYEPGLRNQGQASIAE